MPSLNEQESHLAFLGQTIRLPSSHETDRAILGAVSSPSHAATRDRGRLGTNQCWSWRSASDCGERSSKSCLREKYIPPHRSSACAKSPVALRQRESWSL